MPFADLIRTMVSAVERGDGRAVADCFTPDGVYHDVFYGSFEGPAIVDMIENYFWRDAKAFKWDIHDAVEADGIGYARYVFSYESTLPPSAGRRAIFEGVAICRLAGGRIAEYREVANAVVGLHCMGFAPERLAKFISKQADELRGRAESAGHLD